MGVSSRILDRLVACAVPCVVFAAPAGFGKTHAAKAYGALFPKMAIATAARDMSASQVLAELLRGLDQPETSSESLEISCRNIWQGVGAGCVIVDSAECLGDATLFDVLTALERSRPAVGTLVICIRREPVAFSFADVFAPHLLVVFRRADLELSFSELQACVPAGTKLSIHALYHIYNLTCGWPVPALSLLRSGVAETFDAAGLHLDHPALRDLFDWLDTNVVSTLSGGVRSMLLRCVACRDMVPADFDTIVEGETARADRLLYRNSQCADIGFSGEIRVHPLIALAARARYATDVEGYAHQAATLFLAQGEPVRAARAMVSIGDLERACAALDEAGFDAARELGGFPYPGLLLEHYSRTKPAYERYPLLWLNLVPCRYYTVGPKTLAREGAELLKSYDGRPLGPLERWVVATTSMLFDEAGDLQMAERLAGTLRQPGSHRDAAASLDLAEMYLDVSHGRYRSALERWHRLGAAFRSSPVWYGLHLRCAARAEVRLGNLDAGEDVLRTLSSLLRIGGCPSLATFGDMEAASVAWHKGDVAGFRTYRADFAQIARSYDVPAMWSVLGALYGDDLSGDKPEDLYDALSAVILAADCRDERALPLARRAVASADATSDVAIRIWSRIVAATHDRSGARELVAQAGVLARATDSAALKGLVSTYSEPNSPAAQSSAFLQRLPSHFDMTETDAGSATNALMLYVATGELRRGARSVKVSEGTLQLLLFLGVRGPSNRTTIVDHLWPDLDGDAGNNALKICVHRVRHQLGDAASIVVQKSTYSLGPNVESSYVRIQQLVAIAARPISEAVMPEVSATFDRLTRGLIAGWAPWEWFRPVTRSLIDAMHALGAALGQYELDRGNPQMALQIARRMISVDSVDEGARTLAIRAYLNMQKPAAALAEFREFSFLLNREVGAEPTETLKRLLTGLGNS
jgi:DNA-binding SARP family transcriptional activator